MANGYYIRDIVHQGAEKKLGPLPFTAQGSPMDFTAYLPADAEVVAATADGAVSITGTIAFSVGDSGELDTATATFPASQTALIESTDEMKLMVRVNSGSSAVVLWYGELMPRLEVTA